MHMKEIVIVYRNVAKCGIKYSILPPINWKVTQIISVAI